MSNQDPRVEQLSQRLAIVRQRIQAAVAARNAAWSQPGPGGDPTLIVVTKFHPAADVLRLRSLGVHDVGENRDQEAEAKAQEVADPALRWHFIGQLQKNKAKSVVSYAQSVHSVDRASLISSLGNAMARQQDATGREDLECFLQVDLSEAYSALDGPDTQARAGRGGVAPSGLAALAEQIGNTPGLSLAGLMAVAPLGVAPEPGFELLAQLSAGIVSAHPGATGISAGMSYDLEAAVAAGATHLRVGSDILGPRPVVL